MNEKDCSLKNSYAIDVEEKQIIEKTPCDFQLLFLFTFSFWADHSWLKSSRLVVVLYYFGTNC